MQLAATGESPSTGPFRAIVDTDSDGTLIPNQHLERIEAIGIGEGMLYGFLGEARPVPLYEVDIHIDSSILPGVIVIGVDQGEEIILGRNVLNKLTLILDGPASEMTIRK